MSKSNGCSKDLNKIKFQNEEVDPEFENLIRDFFGMRGIYLLPKKIDEIRKLEFVKEAEAYFLTNNDKKGIIMLLAQGFVDYFIYDVKLKMIICFIKSAYVMGLEDDLEWLMQLLDSALDFISEKLFKQLIDVMEAEPYNNLLAFMNNGFLRVINCETYKFTNDDGIVKISDLLDIANSIEDTSVVNVRCVNIFELAKTIFYRAFEIGKDYKSRELFKRFFQTSFKYMSKDVYDLYVTNSMQYCKNIEPAETTEKKKSPLIANRLLKAGEIIIENLWEYLPELELKKCNQFYLKNAPLNEQIDKLLTGCVDLGSLKGEGKSAITRPMDYYSEIFIDGCAMYANYYGSNYSFEIPKLKRIDVTKLNDRKKNSKQKEFVDPDEPSKPLIIKKIRAMSNETKDILLFELRNRRCISDTNMLSYDYKEAKKYLNLAFQIKNDYEQSNNLQAPSYFPVANSKKDFEQIVQNVSLDYEINDDLNTELLSSKPISYFKECRRYICAACGFLIPQNKGIDALNEYWHEEHFCCGACNIPLINTKFGLYKGVPLCSRDYEKVKLFSCSKCGYPIYNMDAMFSNGKYYHSCHFGCCKCGKIVKETQLYDRKGKPYCSMCLKTSSFEEEQCVYCKKNIHPSKIIYEEDLPWHKKCYFTCIRCRQELKKDDLITYGYDLRLCNVCLPIWNIYDSKEVTERQE